jgi:N-acetylmuramoyl-L-alanine amidase
VPVFVPPPLARLFVVLLFAGMLPSFACDRPRDEAAVRIEPATAAGTGVAQPVRPAGDDRRITVFLDPGHGGRDPGWGASYILPDMPLEKDLTLDVARRTAAYLEEKGYRVVLSRTTDTDVNEPEQDLNGDGCIDPIDEIQARIDLANASGAAALVSIHFNGLPGTQLSGSATFYNAVREFHEDNERLAQLIQSAQLEALAGFGHEARDWGALRDDSFDGPSQTECPTGYRYYTLIGPAAAGRPRPSQMPGVVIEALFLTHLEEAKLAGRPEVRDALARAYAGAIDRFLRPGRSRALGGLAAAATVS